MENDKKYGVMRFKLSGLSVNKGTWERFISPENFKTGDEPKNLSEETMANEKAYGQFKTTLDSLDSDNSGETLDDLFHKGHKDLGIEAPLTIGKIIYSNYCEEMGSMFSRHNMSYDEYSRLGKPDGLNITRVCVDTIESTFDRKK